MPRTLWVLKSFEWKGHKLQLGAPSKVWCWGGYIGAEHKSSCYVISMRLRLEPMRQAYALYSLSERTLRAANHTLIPGEGGRLVIGGRWEGSGSRRLGYPCGRYTRGAVAYFSRTARGVSW